MQTNMSTLLSGFDRDAAIEEAKGSELNGSCDVKGSAVWKEVGNEIRGE